MKKRFAIIGFPLGHSLSPLIHNTAFKHLGLSAQYLKLEIDPHDFESTIEQLKNVNWQGFNVTIPFKEKIFPLLSKTDQDASQIGAVNTIHCTSNGWIGYNTDWLGFLKPLEQRNVFPETCLILGAGGAARAVVFGLLKLPSVQKLVIANRTIEKAEKIKNDFNGQLIQTISLSQLDSLNSAFDLIVNTTSVGMKGRKAQTIVDLEKVTHQNSTVYDLVYNPLRTVLLRQAETLSLQTIEGLEMLVFQAEAAFKIWTRKTFDDHLLNLILEKLKNELNK